jgi:transcriptional regulator with XRE-family HTH domain
MTSQAANQIVTTIGRNIRSARIAAGLTQRALATKLGLDIRAVNRWERAGIMPSAQNLAKLADELGHDPGWFYTDHAEQAAA